MTMRQRNANHNQSARHLTLIVGVAILLWSGMEDNDAVVVSLLGALSATAVVMLFYESKRFSRVRRPRNLTIPALVAGTLIGALACLTTPALMLFKNLRHAHVFPDYPPAMMLAMLERLPSWALAGGLAGLGFGLLLALARESRSQPG